MRDHSLRLSPHVDGTFPISRPIGTGRKNAPEQAFEIGETAWVKHEFVSGRVRMPRYVRGNQGVVVAKSPRYRFPDTAAHDMQVTEEPVYDVRFHSEEL